MKVTVIGLGLIGGSMALDLKSQISVQVYGVDKNESHRNTAISLGLVDDVVDFEVGVEWADVIIVAIPVDGIEGILNDILDAMNEHTIVIDMGSTKSQICQSVAHHSKRGRYVSAHPLAGTEFSGPEAALKSLFLGKKNIVCDRQLSDEDALKTALDIFESLGMETEYMDSKEHDKHLAYVSHLSHISSFTLSLTVQDIEKDERQIFDLAGTGFQSTVRLAKSAPETWAPIFDKNAEHLEVAIDQYIAYLEKFKKALKSVDRNEMKNLIEEANKIKKVLKK